MKAYVGPQVIEPEQCGNLKRPHRNDFVDNKTMNVNEKPLTIKDIEIIKQEPDSRGVYDDFALMSEQYRDNAYFKRRWFWYNLKHYWLTVTDLDFLATYVSFDYLKQLIKDGWKWTVSCWKQKSRKAVRLWGCPMVAKPFSNVPPVTNHSPKSGSPDQTSTK